MHIDSNQLENFATQGYLKLKVFEPDDFLSLKQEISEFVDELADEYFQKGKVSDLYTQADFPLRMACLMRDCPEIATKFDIEFLLGQKMFQMMRHPKLLAMLTDILGDDITCSGIQHLRIKPPFAMTQAQHAYFNPAWHQDSGVSQPNSDESLIVTCWIPLGRASLEMGCLHVHPGVEKHLAHESTGKGTSVVEKHLPKSDPVVLECEQGEMVFMNQFVPHCSYENLSSESRWSIDLRYQKTGTPSARPWLPEFVVQSESKPNSVLTNYDQWRLKWQNKPVKPASMQMHRIG